MTAEDLIQIEQAGRRCSSCHTGRQWRRLEVLRPEGREPLVTCPACRARLTEMMSEPPAPIAAPVDPAPITAPVAPARASRPHRAASSPHHRAPSPRREDRLKRALRTLPSGAHSTGRIAKAAGLNQAKALSRLETMEAAGEVRRVGKQWTTEPASTDLDAAFDRLQARTTNLRIIRPREPVGPTRRDDA